MKGRCWKSAQCCSKNSSLSHSSSVSDLLPLGLALAIRVPRSNLPKACTKSPRRRSAAGASPHKRLLKDCCFVANALFYWHMKQPSSVLAELDDWSILSSFLPEGWRQKAD